MNFQNNKPSIVDSKGESKDTSSSNQETFLEKPKKIFPIKSLLIVIIIFLLIIICTLFLVFRNKILNTTNMELSYVENEEDFTYEDTNYPTDKKEPESTYVNQTPVSLSKVNELISKYGTYTNAYDPSVIKFDHEQEYKGIKIAWTNGSPISAERVQWLKDVIDTLPSSFLSKYPISGFYSAEREEYPAEMSLILTASAVASGTNIYLTPIMASTYMPTLYQQY